MDIFSQIRTAIEQNKIDKTFNLFNQIIPLNKKNDLILLKTQFNKWEEEYHLGINISKEERHRIIYSLLSMVTKIEKQGKNGLKAKKLNVLSEIENSLIKGYEKLQQLKARGELDLLMIWIMNNHQDIFSKILHEEKYEGCSINLKKHLTSMKLDLFIKQYGINTSNDKIQYFIIQQTIEIPAFFTAWLEYSEHRTKYEEKLSLEIEKTKQKRLHLLASGFLGGIISIIGHSIFQDTLNDVLNNEPLINNIEDSSNTEISGED